MKISGEDKSIILSSKHEHQKEMKNYLTLIVLFPLVLANILILVLFFPSIYLYFVVMMDNTASFITSEFSQFQDRLMASSQSLLLFSYAQEFEEVLFIRDSLVQLKEPNNPDITKLRPRLEAGELTCIGKQQLDGVKIPICIDSVFAGGESEFMSTYSRSVGITNYIFNGGLVAKEDLRPFSSWGRESKYSGELAIFFNIFELLMSYRYIPDLLDGRKSTMYVSSSKFGIHAGNFFDWKTLSIWEKIDRKECYKNLHSEITKEKINYDPRCRKWFSHTINFLENYAKKLNLNTITRENLRYPFIISKPYEGIGIKNIVTFCTVDSYTPGLELNQMNTLVACKDLVLDQVIEVLSKNFAQILYEYISMVKGNPDLEKSLKEYPKLGEQGKYVEWLRDMTKHFNQIMGFMLYYLDEDLTYQPILDMFGLINAEKRKKYIEFTKKINNILPPDLENPSDYAESFVYEAESNYQVLVGITSLGVRDIEGRWVEFARIVFAIPDSLLIDSYEKELKASIEETGKTILIGLLFIILLLLLVCFQVRAWAIKVNREMNMLIQAVDQIENGSTVKSREYFADANQEIIRLYDSFIDLNKIMETTSSSFDNLNHSLASLKYTVGLKIFEMLENRTLMGVITNNLGNIHFKAENYKNAVESYKYSLKLLKQAADGPEFRQHSNEEIKQRELSRKMNLVLALKYGFDSESLHGVRVSEIFDDMVSNINDIFSQDHYREDNLERQISCLNISAATLRLKENFAGCKDKIRRAMDMYKILESHKNVEDIFWLKQNTDLQRVELNIKFRNFKNALEIATSSLREFERYDPGTKNQLIRVIRKTFKAAGKKPTPGLEREIEELKNLTFDRQIVIGLDYSSSMRETGNIDQAINSILQLWDSNIDGEDEVAFLTFNLGIKVVFGMDKKKTLEFSKRREIEESYKARDRTSLYDSIIEMLYYVEKISKFGMQQILLIFVDGGDSSSLKELDEVKNELGMSMAKVVIVWLGGDEKDRQVMKEMVECTPDGTLVENGGEKDLGQVLSHFFKRNNNKMPYCELTYESGQ